MSSDVKKHAGHADEAPGARFGRIGGFPGQKLAGAARATTCFSTGYNRTRLVMAESSEALVRRVEILGEIYNLGPAAEPEHEKMTKRKNIKNVQN